MGRSASSAPTVAPWSTPLVAIVERGVVEQRAGDELDAVRRRAEDGLLGVDQRRLVTDDDLRSSRAASGRERTPVCSRQAVAGVRRWCPVRARSRPARTGGRRRGRCPRRPRALAMRARRWHSVRRRAVAMTRGAASRQFPHGDRGGDELDSVGEDDRNQLVGADATLGVQRASRFARRSSSPRVIESLSQTSTIRLGSCSASHVIAVPRGISPMWRPPSSRRRP